jgi:hypothetical protein
MAASMSLSPAASAGALSGEALVAMSLAVVTVAELNLRKKPSSSADLLHPDGVTTPLPLGTRVLVLDGPVEADGLRWYLVGLTSPFGTPVGWVSSGAPGDAWLAPDPAGCPNADVASIATLSPIQRLGCFGSKSLSFEARQVTAPEGAGFGGACAPDPGQPEFLVCERYDFVQADGNPDASLLLRFDPQAGIEPTGLADPGTTGTLWQIQGHFADDASVACATGRDPASIDYSELWLGCATQFVVEGLQSVE